MAPVRRYLRVSRYTVLEVRVYLDNPADEHRWLLRPGNPALPRIIEAVRPLVLPKLREENERAKKGSKKKAVKDVIAQDDFETSVFLTHRSTPHAVLTKQRVFKERDHADHDISGATKDTPFQVEDDAVVMMRREDDDVVDLSAIPLAADKPLVDQINRSGSGSAGEDELEGITEAAVRDEHDQTDEKKKLGLNATYDGFRIFGKTLCLVVKRTSGSKGQATDAGTGQAMLEQWISSTQEPTTGLVD